MSSFPLSISDANRTTLRTSGYWVRLMACLNPNTVVFRARASEAITTDPFIAFTYDSVDIGAEADVWPGMVCYISATTDIRSAKYRGRVRLVPAAGTFYIDYNATLLDDNDYIIVVRDTDLFRRVRDDTLIDSSIAYHALPPMLSGLPNVVVLYDSDADGTCTYTAAVTGIPVDAAATAISTWAWGMSGDGTKSVDNAALQNPTFTFQAGYHYLIRVTLTDDNDVSHTQITQVYVVARTFTAPAVTPIVTSSITGSLDNGWAASVTAYADVSTMIDRTHCVLWALEHFGDNSATPMTDNVWMSGRIRSESIQTSGDERAGQLQQVTFAVEGLSAYLQRLRIPNDIVRPTASPNEWGEITDPTPYRMAVYAMWAYTTLPQITSFGVETGSFGVYEIGAEPRAIEGGFATEVLSSLLSTIKAAVNIAPNGEIRLARNVSYREDRSGVITVTTFTLSDMREYDVDRDSSSTVSQVIAFGGVFDSAINDYVLYSAQSPSIVYDEGEVREITREILSVDATTTEASEELGLRASNEYAYQNPKPLMSLTSIDSYAGLLRPMNDRRWAAVIPASSNTRGIAYGASDYWLLQSATLTINEGGSVDSAGEWFAETSFDDAQSLSGLLPENQTNTNPVLPVLPNDPAFPTDPLELYPTDTPDVDDLQPIDPYTASQSYTPLPPNVAAEAGRRQGVAQCKQLQVPLWIGTNTTSGFTTVLNDPYRITAWGNALLSNGASIVTIDFTASNGGFGPLSGNAGLYGTWIAGEGWKAGSAQIAINKAGVTANIISVTYYFNTSINATVNARNYPFSGPSTPTIIGPTTSYTLATSGLTSPLYLGIIPVPNTSTYRLTRVDLAYAGSGVATYGDWFYQWNMSGEERTNISLLSGGLYLDNSKYTPVPDYNPTGRYENLPFTGTNNTLAARYVLSDYTSTQRLLGNLMVCPEGVNP